jgi:hypothetical protein
MLAEVLPFPAQIPPGYEQLETEPEFDPVHHLALEKPTTVSQLSDVGYDEEVVSKCASAMAITSPFRILSEEGVVALREVALAIRGKATSAGGAGRNRAATNIRGCGYRSRFIRQFCECSIVTEFLSDIAKTPIAPHTMPSMQTGINYAPDDITKMVDTWHVDSIGFVCVMLASDPTRVQGGEFQHFHGTTDEAALLLDTTPDQLTKGFSRDLPRDRVVTAAFPAAGYAVFVQGNMVLHRANRLLRRGERITVIPGYVSRDLSYPDPTNTTTLRTWRDPGIWTELARHKSWISRERLKATINELPFTSDKTSICSALQASISDVEQVIDDLRADFSGAK